MHYVQTLCKFYIITTLIVILGVGCTDDGMDNAYRPSPTAHRACTPETRAASTRAASMYKTLREDPKAKSIHQELVSNIKQQYCFEYANLEEKKVQKCAEEKVIEIQEKIIQECAEKNGRIRLDSSHIRAQIKTISLNLASLNSLPLSQEEKKRWTAIAHLKKEELYLIERLYMILVAANNRE